MESRLKQFYIFICVVIAYAVIHIVAISIFDPYGLERAIELRYSTGTELKYYHRGDIYDRNGKRLVTTVYNYQLDLDKNLIRKKLKDKIEDDAERKELEKIIYQYYQEVIQKHTGLSVQTLKSRIEDTGYTSVYICPNLSMYSITKIKEELYNRFRNSALVLSGDEAKKALIAVRMSEKRAYNNPHLAKRLLGLALPEKEIKTLDEAGGKKKRLNHLNGVCGMEKTFNHLLKGQDGWEKTIYDSHKNKVPKPALKSREPINGLDVYLTINVQYQEILEEKLHEGLLKYQAEKCMGIIMDVNTGEILAIAGEDQVDLTEPGKVRSLPILAVSEAIEPGSTMKPVTALLALEKNLYKPDQLLDCSTWVIKYSSGEKRTIRDHKPFDKLNLRDIIVKSSNPGISRVAEDVGATDLFNKMQIMGMGCTSLSMISGESSGQLRDLKDWKGYSLASVSFGQEMTATVLQLAVMYSAFANGGKILKPQILSYCTKDDTIRCHEMEVKQVTQISEKKYIDELNSYLREVVTRGTGTNTNLDFVQISGKTGTAENIKDDTHNSVFAGFLPSNNPKIAMVIAYVACIEDENQYYYASQSAVPVFKEVVNDVLHLKDCQIMNDDVDEEALEILPNMIGMPKQEAKSILESKNLNYRFVNDKKNGIVSDQQPPGNQEFNINEQVVLALAEEEEKINDSNHMPDFSGLTLREATQLANTLQIEMTATGFGIVVSQSVAPNTKLAEENKCHLVLE